MSSVLLRKKGQRGIWLFMHVGLVLIKTTSRGWWWWWSSAIDPVRSS